MWSLVSCPAESHSSPARRHGRFTCEIDRCLRYRRKKSQQFFTRHKRSCGKVMFSQACVKNSVHRGGCVHPLGRHPLTRQISPWIPPGPGRHPLPTGPGRQPPEQAPPPPGRDSYCSRWYASYWNAFFFSLIFVVAQCKH